MSCRVVSFGPILFSLWFASFRFVSCRFVSVLPCRFVSFRFVSFRFVSFRSVPFFVEQDGVVPEAKDNARERVSCELRTVG